MVNFEYSYYRKSRLHTIKIIVKPSKAAHTGLTVTYTSKHGSVPLRALKLQTSPKVTTSKCMYVSAKLHPQYSIRWSETIMQNKWGATDVRESPFVSGITIGTADFCEITSVSSIEPFVVWLFSAED